MSLLRLLTTGKSLVSVRNTESRYRLTSQRLLPHFGPTKNPFGDTGKPEQSSPSPLLQGGEPVKVRPEAGPRNPAPLLWLKMAGVVNAWKGKLGGVLALPHRKAANPTVSRVCKPPVQTELSLDRVKVVCNDLSDADLEVVSASVRRAPALLPSEPAENVGKGWGRVTTGLFRLGKT